MAEDNSGLWIIGALVSLLGLGVAGAVFGPGLLKPKNNATGQPAQNPVTNAVANMTRSAATFVPSVPKAPGCGCNKH